MCSGCGPTLKPLIEGTYTSYNEEKNETFSKGKLTIKEITKEEYEEANGINVFIDGSTDQRQEKRYLSIEFYLYSIETKQYEKVTLSNFKYLGETPHSYYSEAYLKINNKVYEDDYLIFNFYHTGDYNVHAYGILKIKEAATEIVFSTDFKLE